MADVAKLFEQVFWFPPDIAFDLMWSIHRDGEATVVVSDDVTLKVLRARLQAQTTVLGTNIETEISSESPQETRWHISSVDLLAANVACAHRASPRGKLERLTKLLIVLGLLALALRVSYVGPAEGTEASIEDGGGSEITGLSL